MLATLLAELVKSGTPFRITHDPNAEPNPTLKIEVMDGAGWTRQYCFSRQELQTDWPLQSIERTIEGIAAEIKHRHDLVNDAH